jgi:hypothetical protein
LNEVNKIHFGLALLAIILFQISEGVHAQYEKVQLKPVRNHLRALGMGGAFIALAEEEGALIYNPAGLGRLDTWNFQLDLAQFGGVMEGYDFYKEVEKVDKISGLNDKITAVESLLKKYEGKIFTLRGKAAGIYFVRPRWGFGIQGADGVVDMGFFDLNNPFVRISAVMDSRVTLGHGYLVKNDYLGGHLFLGANAHFINRNYFSKRLTVLDIVSAPELFKKEDFSEGATWDFDLGFLYEPYLPMQGWASGFHYFRPSFGWVIRNVFANRFTQKTKWVSQNEEATEPPKLLQVVDLGSKFEFLNFWVFRGRLLYDVRNLGHPQFSMGEDSGYGGELDFDLGRGLKAQFRAGVSGGFWTSGASLRFLFLLAEIASYGEKVQIGGREGENRQTQVKISLTF